MHPKRPNRIRIARALLGAGILLAVLAASVPHTTIASGPLCTMSCCAGRAPHAAGSCMDGSCHAFLVPQGDPSHSHHHSGLPTEQSHQPDGPRRATGPTTTLTFRESSAANGHAHSEDSHRGERADVRAASTLAIRKPCRPDCGSCATASINFNKKRNIAALSSSVRSRPQSSIQLTVDYGLIKSLALLICPSCPRGPPPVSVT